MAAANALNIHDAGYVVFDGAGVFEGRTFQAGTGITITNPDGIAGNTTISSTAATTDLHVARYIVASSTTGTGANYTTISAAIVAAQGTGIPSTIFIQPGTYTENFTLTSGINLTAFPCDANSSTPNVKIVGKITAPASGVSVISNIAIQNSADVLLAAGAGTLLLYGCQLIIMGISNSGISGAFRGSLYNCNLTLNGTNVRYFALTGAASVNIINCTSTTAATASASTVANSGSVSIHYSNILEPITSSDTAQLDFRHSTFGSTSLVAIYLTANGTGTVNSAINCAFISTLSAISVGVGATFNLSNCSINSSATNVITGAGTIRLSDVSFTNTSSTINTTTQVPSVSFNDAVKVVTPGAYPYTTVPQDQLILVDTSSARTIVPLASPTTGQRHIIKDSVGSGGLNFITITPSGKNIDGAASALIISNYGSLTIVYNGTEWNII